MPRTKGSKNKAKIAAVDYIVQIEEKQKEKDAALAELANAETAIQELEDQLAEAKETLKAKKADIKLTKLAAKKAKADAAAEAEAKKTEAQEMVSKLLAEGMSVDEILEKLK